MEIGGKNDPGVIFLKYKINSINMLTSNYIYYDQLTYCLEVAFNVFGKTGHLPKKKKIPFDTTLL